MTRDADTAERDAKDLEKRVAEGDPFTLFGEWLALAEQKEPNDPNAMAIATAGSDGLPDVRMVLLKDVDPDGFVFYTNLESAKGQELAANPKAALCFHWKSMLKVVRVDGAVEKVGDSDADAYFNSRSRGSQIGAWASKQSQPLKNRFELEKKIAAYAAKFHIGEVPRPDFWEGYRVVPRRIEFWAEGTFRLHDRIVYTAEGNGDWLNQLLYP